jgi:hypothetical protein
MAAVSKDLSLHLARSVPLIKVSSSRRQNQGRRSLHLMINIHWLSGIDWRQRWR